MKVLKGLRFLVAIVLMFSSCSELDNPTKVTSDEDNWMEIASFDELKTPYIHFFNEDEGIIAGSVYYDEVLFEGPPIVYLANKDTIEIIINKLIDSSSTAKYPMWKTFDGGMNWNPIKGTFRTSIIDMQFIDNFTGFVVTDSEGVFKTNDGGDHWFRIMGAKIRFYSKNKVFPDEFTPKEIDFYDADNGIINGVFNAQQNSFLCLKTNNGGLSWDYYDLPYRIEELTFPEINSKIGFAVRNRNIIKTYDGGLNWNSIIELDSSPKFSFLDHNNGAYYDDRKLYWTSDGGASFNEAHDFENPELYAHFLQWIDNVSFSNNIFYIEAYEEIRFSKDSCKTFISISHKGLALCNISCPTENVIYATTNNIGKVYKYVNSN